MAHRKTRIVRCYWFLLSKASIFLGINTHTQTNKHTHTHTHTHTPKLPILCVLGGTYIYTKTKRSTNNTLQEEHENRFFGTVWYIPIKTKYIIILELPFVTKIKYFFVLINKKLGSICHHHCFPCFSQFDLIKFNLSWSNLSSSTRERIPHMSII